MPPTTRATVPTTDVNVSPARGSSSSSSQASSIDRAAAIISWAAPRRCSNPSRAGSGRSLSPCTTSGLLRRRVGPPVTAPSVTGPSRLRGLRRLVTGEHDPQFAFSQRRGGDPAPAQRIGQEQRAPVRTHADEQLVVAPSDVEVVVVRKRELQRQVVSVRAPDDLEWLAGVERLRCVPLA